MGWREEVVTALDEWIAVEGGAGGKPRWRRLGRAVRTGEGVFSVDVRGTELNVDQLDSLRLAEAERSSTEAGFAVMDVSQSGSALTVRVAEFADPVDPHLWLLQQPPTFLVTALKEGLVSSGDAPLGNLLAQGKPQGVRSGVRPPAGLFPPQEDAYRACLGSGVWLVWGPPGTGKTMVLKKAIGDLIAAGRRVLLVSATNIAVDNALLGVLAEKRHERGAIVRVGPPQLHQVAENADVSLPLLVRAKLTNVEATRRKLSALLAAIRARGRKFNELEAALTGFDAAAYARDRNLLNVPGRDIQTVEAAVKDHAARTNSLATALTEAETELEQARLTYSATENDRRLWTRVNQLGTEAEQLDQAATQKEVDALLAGQKATEAQHEVDALEARTGFARLRVKRTLAVAKDALKEAQQTLTDLKVQATSARGIADRRRNHLAEQARTIAASTTHSRQQVRLAEQRVAGAVTELGKVRAAHEQAGRTLKQAEDLAEHVRHAHSRVTEAEHRGHPARQAELDQLRPLVSKDAAEAKPLEMSYRQVQEEYERLARDAQGEIIDSAFLVATTLARFRTNKRVFAGSYDVVLVDEAGAATLPEVLLAVAKAKTTAVMFGDFMQLGAVIPQALRESTRSDIRRWLLPDVFGHCGIRDPAAARDHPSCLSLVTQNRFGPTVMDLANALAYDATLLAGPLVKPRGDDDPEIVLIDTDELHELANPHLTGAASGWWPAGVLLSRALAEFHVAEGADVGIVTPYRSQAEATLEALRDIEGGGSPLAEVGTAHRFQGREFPIVIFDTVEGNLGRNLWMAQASRAPRAGDWQRSGLRLFNVAITRVRTRLYLIASQRRIAEAPQESAFAHVRSLLQARRIRRVSAGALITPPRAVEAEPYLGIFGGQLKEVLSRHVEVTDMYDERDFFAAFSAAIRAARRSLWIWSPWVARRVQTLLADLRDAAARGVRITVFLRDPSDHLQREHLHLIAQVRAIVHTVVPINDMHQKIVVIDEQVVMLGSLNTLSQSRTREVMLTMRGGHFARRILEHEHAVDFAAPPSCPRCGERDIEIRRGARGWYWRCYNKECPTGAGRSAWRQTISFGSRRPASDHAGTNP